MCCVSLLTVTAKHRIDTVNSKLHLPELRWYPGCKHQEKATNIRAKVGFVKLIFIYYICISPAYHQHCIILQRPPPKMITPHSPHPNPIPPSYCSPIHCRLTNTQPQCLLLWLLQLQHTFSFPKEDFYNWHMHDCCPRKNCESDCLCQMGRGSGIGFSF